MSLRSSFAPVPSVFRSRFCFTACLGVGMLLGTSADAGPLTVQEVVDRVREAGGWDAANPAGKLVALAGRGSLIGVEQDVEMLLSPKGDYYAAYRGDLPIAEGVITAAPTLWTRDLGNEILTPSLGDADTLRLRALALTGAWTAPGTLELRLHPLTSDNQAVLNFKLPGGLIAGVIRIDRKDWRVTEWSYSAGDGDRGIRFEGSIASGPGWFPSRVISTGTSGEETTIELASAALASDAQAAMLQKPALRNGHPDDVSFDASVPAELEVKRARSGHLLVRPKVNSREAAWWIFDTGAGQNCVDKKVVESLGLRRFGVVPVNGIGGTIRSNFVRPATLTLGPVTLSDPIMTELDLSMIGTALGEEIGGIIGFNTIFRCVARVDLALARVSLHDPVGFDAAGINWTPVRLYGRHPIVDAGFEGRHGLFKLDTGANNTVSFHVPAVENLKLLDGRETTESKSGGVGGMRTVRRGKVASFELGGKKLDNVDAEFATEKVGAFHDAYSLGNIGVKLMRGFELVFDYQNGRMGFVDRPLPEKKDAPKTDSQKPDAAGK